MALFSGGCVAGPETVDTNGQPQAAAGEADGAEAASGEELVRPVVSMPPPPPERSDAEVWQEAQHRSATLKGFIDTRIATVTPGPYPEPKKKPARKKKPASAETVRKNIKSAPPVASVSSAAPVEAKATVPKTEEPTESFFASYVQPPTLSSIVNYTTDNGLPDNLVTAIYVDETDAWVGTSGGGVARYNFVEDNWIVTGQADGLISDIVTSIVKFKGKVFIGTARGLSVWDGFSWEHFEDIDRVKLMNIVFAVSDDTLWVASRNMRGGLLSFDGDSWKNRSNIRPGVILNNVSAMGFDGKTMWLGTTSRGVYVKRGRTWTVFSVSDGIASNFIYSLTVNNGKSYLGGCCGVSYYDGTQWEIFDVPEGLPHSTVNDVLADGDIVWMGSKNGLSAYNGEDFTNYFAEDGLLADNRVTTLFVRKDELWVGTAGGLSRLRIGD